MDRKGQSKPLPLSLIVEFSLPWSSSLYMFYPCSESKMGEFSSWGIGRWPWLSLLPCKGSRSHWFWGGIWPDKTIVLDHNMGSMQESVFRKLHKHRVSLKSISLLQCMITETISRQGMMTLWLRRWDWTSLVQFLALLESIAMGKSCLPASPMNQRWEGFLCLTCLFKP